jgi:hypothetical protein
MDLPSAMADQGLVAIPARQLDTCTHSGSTLWQMPRLLGKSMRRNPKSQLT